MATRKAGGGKVVVLGVKEIDRKLRRLQPKVARQVVRTAMREAMRPVAAAVKAEAPVGKTGELRRAVKLRTGKTKRGAGPRMNVVIGDGWFRGDTFYAAFVELGTHKMQSRLYMTQVYERMKNIAKADAIERIKAGIKAVGGGRS